MVPERLVTSEEQKQLSKFIQHRNEEEEELNFESHKPCFHGTPKSSGVMRFWIWTSVLSTASFPPGSRASGCGSAMEGAADLERASSPNSNCFDFKRVVQNTPTCAGVEYVSLNWLCGTDSYALSSSSPLNRLILFYSTHHSFFISPISRSCSSMARIECTTTLQSIEFSFRKAGLNV